MRNEDYNDFAELIDGVYDLIGSGATKVISASAKALFFRAMKPYSMADIRSALATHCAESHFVPKPADLIDRIKGLKGDDGRPNADEAWAIALQGRDESDTVVWTDEIAEAFCACNPVLAMDDVIGARMAFRDAYNRIVSNSRNKGLPVRWNASVGWDVSKRTSVLSKAALGGLLPAPFVAALLPPPESDLVNDQNAKVQLEKIRKMMESMIDRRKQEAELHSQREREKLSEAKNIANDMANNYGSILNFKRK